MLIALAGPLSLFGVTGTNVGLPGSCGLPCSVTTVLFFLLFVVGTFPVVRRRLGLSQLMSRGIVRYLSFIEKKLKGLKIANELNVLTSSESYNTGKE